jgi:MoxR-like ATPase
MAHRFADVDEVTQRLAKVSYLATPMIANVAFLADRLEKPVLAEGPAGVGKTELAKALAAATGARLIRLQCYEGLDESKALYEWNYKKQLLRIQADRAHDASWADVEADIFSEPFLLTRPLLEAIRAADPVVLLIDEVDRVEVETEALLLEVLSDFQVSIPELGTVAGTQRPLIAGAACTSTSTTRTWSASARSSGPGCPRSTSSWPPRSPRWSGPSASSS